MNVSQPVFDHAYVRRPLVWLALICLCYVAVAVNYAVQTPAWQAPDEPAHYNYIEHIATTGTLPILEMGDYDQGYLEYLLSRQFAPGSDYTRLRYESYQPPLYYLIGALLYRLSDGDLLAVRLLNVGFGLMLILLSYAALTVVFPHRTMLTLGATAFAAFLPMHVAVTAAVNNDVLAELLVVASVMILLVWMRQQFQSTLVNASTTIDGEGGNLSETIYDLQHDLQHGQQDSLTIEPLQQSDATPRLLLILGLLLGLGLLTKIYAYAMVPLCMLAIALTAWRVGGSWHRFMRGLLWSLYVLIPAVVLGLPWWLRNIYWYGIRDPLGLRWHDQVVTGQPTTTDWIATNGIMNYSERAFNLTFQSFWGVFGWLGVFMDSRIYTALLIATGILFLGLLWSLIRLISGMPDSDLNTFQRWVLLFFALMLLVVTASYAWYNMKFVQHQGRYFFWGLLPIGTFVALGWREIMRPLQGIITGVLALILAISLAFTGYIGDSLNKWTILTIGLAACLLLLQPLLFVGHERYKLIWLPGRIQQLAATPNGLVLFRGLRFLAWASPALLLLVLNVAIPMLFIVPQLTQRDRF